MSLRVGRWPILDTKEIMVVLVLVVVDKGHNGRLGISGGGITCETTKDTSIYDT